MSTSAGHGNNLVGAFNFHTAQRCCPVRVRVSRSGSGSVCQSQCVSVSVSRSGCQGQGHSSRLGASTTWKTPSNFAAVNKGQLNSPKKNASSTQKKNASSTKKKMPSQLKTIYASSTPKQKMPAQVTGEQSAQVTVPACALTVTLWVQVRPSGCSLTCAAHIHLSSSSAH